MYVMKKLILFAFAALGGLVQAQTANYDVLDLGNFVAPIRSDGQLFQDDQLTLLGLEWPKTAITQDKRSLSYSANIWFGGRKANGSIAVAAETFGQSGQTYHPGLYDFNGAQWDSVWKITRVELDQFRQDFQNSTINFSNYPVIQHWPAFGTDINGQVRACAPFIDMDNDPAHYTPLAGDYPDFPGDQAIYFQFADYPATLTAYLNPTGIEVRAFAYVYACTELQDVLFLKYDLTNRSGIEYSNFQMGLWNDADIGNYTDDYLATDPSRDLFIGYNGDSYDETAQGYGLTPPALGWTCLTEHATGGMYYNNDMSTKGNPMIASDYYFYLTNLWKDSTALVDNGLDGWQTTAPGTPAQFPYPGNPGWCGGLSSGWTEGSAGNQPYDRRALLSVGGNSFSEGATQSYTFAMMAARDSVNQSLGSVCKLLQVSDSLHLWWETNSGPCGSLLAGVDAPRGNSLAATLYPNPSHDHAVLRFENASGEPVQLQVIDITGRTVMPLQTTLGKQFDLDLRDLSAGVYYMRLTCGTKTFVGKMVRN